MGIGDFLKKKLGVVTPAAPAVTEPEPELDEQEEDTDADASASDDDDQEDFGGWDPDDFEEYWFRVQRISLGYSKGEAELAKQLARFGLTDGNQFSRVQNTFNGRFGSDSRFMQAMMTGSQRAQQDLMQEAAAARPDLLAPIGGVSIEVWAKVSARKMQLKAGDAGGLGKLLAEFGVDEATFHRADQGWQAKMRQADDPMAAAAVATEYAKHFAAAGQGAYGATGQAASAGLGLGGSAAAGAAGGEPCTFERFVEIMTAQGAWSAQGLDIGTMLQKAFGFTIMDYSNISAYWSQKQQTDWQKYHSLYTQHEAKFKAKYSQPSADDDLAV